MHVLSVLGNKPDLAGGGRVARFGVVGQQGDGAVALMHLLAQPGMSWHPDTEVGGAPQHLPLKHSATALLTLACEQCTSCHRQVSSTMKAQASVLKLTALCLHSAVC